MFGLQAGYPNGYPAFFLFTAAVRHLSPGLKNVAQLRVSQHWQLGFRTPSVLPVNAAY